MTVLQEAGQIIGSQIGDSLAAIALRIVFPITIDASGGVATFAGLTVDQPAQGDVIQASGDGGAMTATST